MVADSRAKMNKFVMGISDLVFNEYRSDRLIPSKQIEDKKLKQVGRELKRVRTEDGNSSKTKFEVQEKQRFKRRFSPQGPPNAPRVNKSKVVVLMLRILFVQNVVKNMMVSS